MVASLPNAKVGAIIVAAGASSRMGDAGDKTLADLAGEPLIARTVDVFERCADVECVALVVSERNRADVAALREEKGWRKTTPPVLGGARRQDSVRAGLEALPIDCGWIVVHDGARPFVTAEMIEAGLDAARHTGAAVAVVPAFDTVKRIAPDGSVAETLDRAELRMAQTPQVFRRDILERAHAEIADDATDDAAMAERIGVEVRTFPGSRENIKITTAEDLGVVRIMSAEAAMHSLTIAPISNDELQFGSIIESVHERALSIIDSTINQIHDGFQLIPMVSELEDPRAWRMLLWVRALKGLRSARILLGHAYHEQAWILCRTAREHVLVGHGLAVLDIEKRAEILRKLRHGKNFDGRRELKEIREGLDQHYGYSHAEQWKDKHSFLNQFVHPSGTSSQVVVGHYVFSRTTYYDPYLVLGVLFDITEQLMELVYLVDMTMKDEGIDWESRAVGNELIALLDEISQEFESMPDDPRPIDYID